MITNENFSTGASAPDIKTFTQLAILPNKIQISDHFPNDGHTLFTSF